jgi:hypothetical protein
LTDHFRRCGCVPASQGALVDFLDGRRVRLSLSQGGVVVCVIIPTERSAATVVGSESSEQRDDAPVYGRREACCRPTHTLASSDGRPALQDTTMPPAHMDPMATPRAVASKHQSRARRRTRQEKEAVLEMFDLGRQSPPVSPTPVAGP